MHAVRAISRRRSTSMTACCWRRVSPSRTSEAGAPAQGCFSSPPPLRTTLAGSDDRRLVRLVTEADAAALQVVGAHLHDHAVADAGADAELAHLAGRVGQDLVIVVELHAEIPVRQDFD